MYIILPKKITNPQILYKTFKVNDANGKTSLMEFYNDKENSYVKTQTLTPIIVNYLNSLNVLGEYNLITYNAESKIKDINEAMIIFDNFRIISYESSTHRLYKPIPIDTFPSTYTTITYCKFEKRNIEPSDTLICNYYSNDFDYVSSFQFPRMDKKIVIFDQYFTKINNHVGYYSVNGLLFYIVTNYIIFGNSTNEKPQFNEIEIQNVDELTLNFIYGLFNKYNVMPTVEDDSIFAIEDETLLFVGNAPESKFTKYLIDFRL